MLKDEGGNGMDEGALEAVKTEELSHGRGSGGGPKDQEGRGPRDSSLSSFFLCHFPEEEAEAQRN